MFEMQVPILGFWLYDIMGSAFDYKNMNSMNIIWRCCSPKPGICCNLGQVTVLLFLLSAFWEIRCMFWLALCKADRTDWTVTTAKLIQKPLSKLLILIARGRIPIITTLHSINIFFCATFFFITAVLIFVQGQLVDYIGTVQCSELALDWLAVC